MKKYVISAAAAALAFGGASNAYALNFTPADCATGNFCVQGDAVAPGVDDVITATIGHNITTGGAFSDSFLFTIDADGSGSGSVVTSFAGSLTNIILTGLFINDVDYSGSIFAVGSGWGAAVNGIPIVAGALNTITITGNVTGAVGSYGGNLTFQKGLGEPPVVPEAGTWAMMILGMAGIGFAMRRRNQNVKSLNVSYA